MPNVITDEMLDEWAIVSTYDDFVAAAKSRCDGLFTTTLLDLPPALRANDDWLRQTVAALK